jgi:glycerol-3-phosphate dehydrogenase
MNVSLIMTAVQHGATVANYTEVVALHKAAASGKLRGARVKDKFTGEEFNVRAKVRIIIDTLKAIILRHLRAKFLIPTCRGS